MDTIIMLTVSLTFLMLSLLFVFIKDSNHQFVERREVVKKEINSIQDYIDEVDNSKVGILNVIDIVDTNIVDILKK